MNLQLDMIEDKIEFFEAVEIKSLEKKINEHGKTFYSAVVHFKANKTSI